jgi:hypothetical protein
MSQWRNRLGFFIFQDSLQPRTLLHADAEPEVKERVEEISLE